MADQICTTLYESGPRDRFKIKKKTIKPHLYFYFTETILMKIKCRKVFNKYIVPMFQLTLAVHLLIGP